MSYRLRVARTFTVAGVVAILASAAAGLNGGTSFAASVGPGSTISVGNAPYSTAGKTRDPNRDGYHFILNQLDYPSGSLIDANDFGPINITFSNGTTATASFTDLAGGSVAHFLNSTVNQSGNFTITSATMTFPAGTDITGYGNFVISHPPCGTVTTTTTSTSTTSTSSTTTSTPTTTPESTTSTSTTTPESTTSTSTTTPESTTSTSTTTPESTTSTTTTTPESTTSTTIPDSTTSTSAPGASTTTTDVLSEVPVPGPTTSTTLVGSAGPTTTTAVDSGARALPTTGGDAARLALLGVVLAGLGLLGMALARRTTS